MPTFRICSLSTFILEVAAIIAERASSVKNQKRPRKRFALFVAFRISAIQTAPSRASLPPVFHHQHDVHDVNVAVIINIVERIIVGGIIIAVRVGDLA